MKYLIEINTDNDAFVGDPETEVTDILERLSLRIQRLGLEDEAPLFDVNGNRVGTARLESDLQTHREIPTLDQEDV